MKFNSDPDFLKKRAEAYKVKKDNPNSTDGDFLFKTRLRYYTPKDGENIVRLLPAMWEGAMFPFLDIYVHYQIGANNSQFLCLAKMANKPCPICEEGKIATDRGEKPEVVRTLFPQHRAVAWIVDRLEPTKGPIVWTMPYKNIAHQIITISFKRSTGEPIFVDDPTDGRDILFTKGGKGIGTTYSGVRKDDDSTPLHADPETAAKWLEIAETQNLKDQLVYKEYNHIKAVLHGTEEEKPTSTTSEAHANDTDIESAMPTKSSEPVAEANTGEITVEKLKAMTLEQLVTFVKEKNLGVDISAWNSDELPEVIALELGLNP